jgi:hypothetical protein
MWKFKKAWLLLAPVMVFLMTGCASMTNLTPSRQVRSADGMYPFEVAWKSTKQSLRKETIKAYVIIGYDSFPMSPTQVVKNRWEAIVPIAPEVRYLTYRYKFDFEYSGIGKAKKDSKLSPSYELKIVDK